MNSQFIEPIQFLYILNGNWIENMPIFLGQIYPYIPWRNIGFMHFGQNNNYNHIGKVCSCMLLCISIHVCKICVPTYMWIYIKYVCDRLLKNLRAKEWSPKFLYQTMEDVSTLENVIFTPNPPIKMLFKNPLSTKLFLFPPPYKVIFSFLPYIHYWATCLSPQ